VVAALREHLHGDVGGDQILFNQRAQELVLRLARGGKADLDLLEAELHEKTEEVELFLKAHRHDQALVAVAQVDAAPDGRRFNVVLLRPAHLARGRGEISGLVLVGLHHGLILSFAKC